MGLTVKNKVGPSIPPVEAGTYAALCVGIVDLGEQRNEMYKKYEDKVLFIWELGGVSCTVDGEEKPRWISKDFSATLNEKSNLTKILVPWRGKAFTDEELNGEGFSLLDMLGQGCLLQVTVEDKDGKQYNRINGVMGMVAGMASPTTQTPLMVFDMDNWDDEALVALPSWVQERIKKSTQYQKLHTPTDEVDFPKGDGTDGANSDTAGTALAAVRPTTSSERTGASPVPTNKPTTAEQGELSQSDKRGHPGVNTGGCPI